MTKITWTTEKRKLSDLKPYSKNPRKLNAKQYGELKDSLERFGLAEIPAVNTNNLIAAGHQRYKILTDLYGSDHEIDVRVPNRLLTDKEFDEYLIRSNKNGGEFDFNMLEENFEFDDLIYIGFDEAELNFTMEAEFEDVEDAPIVDELEDAIPEVKLEISCTDEIEAQSLYNELIKRGLKCKMIE